MTAQIRGRVQGVFYRASARDVALRLGLRGGVRNRRDGSVELWAEGEESALQALLDWCWRGPPAARVQDIAVTWSNPTGKDDDFVVAPTV